MRTDPLGDAWDFLVGAQPDQIALGEWRWPFVVLFWALLAASLLIALVAWQHRMSQRGTTPFVIWLFRVLIGIMWFQGALWKFPAQVAGGLQRWTGLMAENAAYDWFGNGVKRWLLPHMEVLDPLVFAAELVLAFSFILGVAVRPVALLGAVYALLLWIGLYRDPAGWPWQYLFLSIAQCFFALTSGQALGVDALFVPAWRRYRARATR